MVRQAIEAPVEVLLKGRKSCGAWIGRRCNCAAENLSEVLMWVVNRPFGKARLVGIAGLDEVNPVADESVRDACVVGSLDPAGPVALAEKHKLLGMKCAERGEVPPA